MVSRGRRCWSAREKCLLRTWQDPLRRRTAMAPLARVVLMAATLLLTSLTAQAVVPYRITDLGDLPGGSDFSVARGINDAGRVVGFSSAATGSRAFLWTRAGGMRDLGDLPGGRISAKPSASTTPARWWVRAVPLPGLGLFGGRPAAGCRTLAFCRGSGISAEPSASTTRGHVVGDSTGAGTGRGLSGGHPAAA